MKNQIVIHGTGNQTRIALLENGELAQLFIEAPENQRTVGDIYVAQVHKVMSGIRAAFIDMGTPKDAFLHFSDVGDNLEDYIEMLNGKGSVGKAIQHNKRMNRRYNNGRNRHDKNLSPGVKKQMRAGEVMQPGQKLLVQIVKEPIGSKGPRVSTDITLAGRFVVLIPKGDYVAVSKRIRSYKERRRLKNLIGNELPEGFGVIVRTVAKGQPDEVLKQDIKDVLNKWQKILEDLKTAKPPHLLYRDMDMTDSLIRDLFAKDFNNVLIDDQKTYKQIHNYVSKVAPQMAPSIKHYKGKEHIFDHMNIAQDVESVFSPRVKMPSGGYLIFEQTEAMYVVDVNSGRYAAKRHQEENSLKTNLEAARGVAKQLRLRDIGGIIVVDFIDLKSDHNRKKVYDELKKEFKKDKAKTNVLPMSDFGLVQITRQRIRPSVVNSVSRVCPMCGGSGNVVSQNTIIADIEAWLAKFSSTYSNKHRQLDLYINPYLRSYLTRGLFSQRLKWMFKYKLRLNIIAEETVSMNDYKFTLSGNDADITEAVMHDQDIEKILKQNEEEISRLASATKVDSDDLDVEKRGGKSKKSSSNSGKDQRHKNLPDALEVAKNYALKHGIKVKPVNFDDKDDKDVYEEDDDNDKKNKNGKHDDKDSALKVAQKYANKNDIDPEDNMINGNSDSDDEYDDDNSQKDAQEDQQSDSNNDKSDNDDDKDDQLKGKEDAFDVAKAYADDNDIDQEEMLRKTRSKDEQPDDHDQDEDEQQDDQSSSSQSDSDSSDDSSDTDDSDDDQTEDHKNVELSNRQTSDQTDVDPQKTDDGKPKVNDINAETKTSMNSITRGAEVSDRPQRESISENPTAEETKKEKDEAPDDHDDDSDKQQAKASEQKEESGKQEPDTTSEESKKPEPETEQQQASESTDEGETDDQTEEDDQEDIETSSVAIKSSIQFIQNETPQIIEIEVHEMSAEVLERNNVDFKLPKSMQQDESSSDGNDSDQVTAAKNQDEDNSKSKADNAKDQDQSSSTKDDSGSKPKAKDDNGKNAIRVSTTKGSKKEKGDNNQND